MIVSKAALAATGLATLLLLTGCGAAASTSTTTHPKRSALGLVESVKGTVVTVRGTSADIPVALSADTRISRYVVVAPTDLKTGDCVSVKSAAATAGTTVAATRIQVLTPSSGTCAYGGSSADSSHPYGAFAAFGALAAVGAGSVTVTEKDPASSGSRTATVTFTGATTILTAQTAPATSITVGECARVEGTDSKGQLAAKEVTLSPAVGGACTAALVA